MSEKEVFEMKKERSLSPKQAIFVSEYLTDKNAYQAALRAGYREKTARGANWWVTQDVINKGKRAIKNNIKPAIEAGLAEQQEKLREKGLVTAEYVIKGLLEIAERCLQKIPVKDRQGNQVQDEEGNNVWTFDANGASRAFDLLGRYLGMFQSKNAVNITLDGQVSTDHVLRTQERRIVRRLLLEEVRENPPSLTGSEDE